jgi:elongation factor 3
MGVRSNTRAILKLSNSTFTYPGRDTPSLYNISCALSLSRQVQIALTASEVIVHCILTAESVLLDQTVRGSQH